MKAQSLSPELLSTVDPLQWVVYVYVEVQPVLDLLGLWDPLQVDDRDRETGGWLEMDPPSLNLPDDPISEKLRPERSDGTRIDHIDAHFDRTDRVHVEGP